MWVMNSRPHAQQIGSPFSYADFQAGIGQASVQRGTWVAGPTERSWRESGGLTCSINPSRLVDVQGWKTTGGPAITTVNAATPVPPGSTEIRISAELSVVLDPSVPQGEARWRAHWEKN